MQLIAVASLLVDSHRVVEKHDVLGNVGFQFVVVKVAPVVSLLR